ncbi:glycerate kinase family protein [Oerskovia enterophila]|uniref:Glycerate kinase family protein n=3 Tax=Oerskovia enterophila TaxID=43678 RepID=A0ABX2Y431_9CELL|nr:glycerate kinase family protein [Oerskovia enterophila]
MTRATDGTRTWHNRAMRLLLAVAEPLALTDGTLSASEARDLVATVWGAASGALVDACVLDPGADGFLRALAEHVTDEVVTVARDTRGRDVPVTFRLGPASPGGARTAYVEAAALRATVGSALTDPPGASAHPDQGDLGARTSYGVGQVVAQAARLASRVVVATGGLGAHDAGAGLVAALAGAGDGPLTRGGTALGEAGRADAAQVLAAREHLAGTELVGAVDSDLPLLGLHGTNGALADADPALAALGQELERAHGHWAHEVSRALAHVPTGPASRSLLAGPTAPPGPGARAAAGAAQSVRETSRALTALPGAGAGGGLGFGLAALGARLLPGTAVVADVVGLDARVAAADLAVVVVDALDASAVHDGALPEVARRAAALGLPVVVLAREVLAGRREQAAAGISGAYELGRDLSAARARVGRVARTWSGSAPGA